MSVDSKQTAARHRSAAGVCPHCGQPLVTEGAARRLHESEHELQRRLEEAVRSILAELAAEHAAASDPDPATESGVRTMEGVSAADERAIRLTLRQF